MGSERQRGERDRTEVVGVFLQMGDGRVKYINPREFERFLNDALVRAVIEIIPSFGTHGRFGGSLAYQDLTPEDAAKIILGETNIGK